MEAYENLLGTVALRVDCARALLVSGKDISGDREVAALRDGARALTILAEVLEETRGFATFEEIQKSP